MTNAAGSDSVYAPKVMQRLGQQATISLASYVIVRNPQPLHLGLKMNFFPSRSADGSSLDIGMLAQYTVPTGASGAPADSQ
jgi:hypothetical protein